MAALTRARAWRYQHIGVSNHDGADAAISAPSSVEERQLSGAGGHTAGGAGTSHGGGGGGGGGGGDLMFGFTQLSTRSMEEDGNGLYEGERNEAGERDGRGCYRFADGGVYEGSWVSNLQEGYGVMRYASGSVYEGQWEQGMQNGRGVFRFASGSEYDGEWVRGKRHGRATYRYADGRAEVARYRDGANDRGEGAMWSADRRVAWRIVRDGEYVEEISLTAAKSIADGIGEPVPARTR